MSMMKFKYDINDDYFNIFNESQGIVTFRSEIEKDPYKVDTYLGKCVDYSKYVFVLLVLTLIFNFINSEWFISKIVLFAFAILCAFVVALLVVFFMSYFQQKKLFHSGEICFDKNGILDNSDSGIKIGIKWDLVDLVIVKDKIIVLLTKSNFYFHFDEELIDDVLKALNKFHSDVKIIDVSLNRYKADEEELVKFKKIDEIKLNEVVVVDDKEDIEEDEDDETVDEEVVEEDAGVVINELEEISFEKLNPISEEVVEMDKDTIKEIIIPPYDETEESIDDED